MQHEEVYVLDFLRDCTINQHQLLETVEIPNFARERIIATTSRVISQVLLHQSDRQSAQPIKPEVMNLKFRVAC